MTLTPRDHLLPVNASALEQVFASAGKRIQAIPAPIEMVMLPFEVAASFLPFMAWGLSVDIWYDDWAEIKRRQVVADAVRLHRLKGTLAGIRAHLALVDCVILKAIRPPAIGWHTPAMTGQDRRAWLEALPQIRTYPFVTRAVTDGRSFLNGPWGHGFHAYQHMQANRGQDVYGLHAVYTDGPRDTRARLIRFVPPVRSPADSITLARGWRRRLYHGAAWLGRGFLTGSTADCSTFTARLQDDSYAVASGTRVADVRATRIVQPRIAPRARAFFKRRGGFLLPSFAPMLIYDRTALIDEARPAPRRKVATYHGYGRFGIKPYHAELTVAVPMWRPKPCLARFLTGFLKAADMRPLYRAIDAISVSKSARDVIHIRLPRTQVVPA